MTLVTVLSRAIFWEMYFRKYYFLLDRRHIYRERSRISKILEFRKISIACIFACNRQFQIILKRIIEQGKKLAKFKIFLEIVISREIRKNNILGCLNSTTSCF